MEISATGSEETLHIGECTKTGQMMKEMTVAQLNQQTAVRTAIIR